MIGSYSIHLTFFALALRYEYARASPGLKLAEEGHRSRLAVFDRILHFATVAVWQTSTGNPCVDKACDLRAVETSIL